MIFMNKIEINAKEYEQILKRLDKLEKSSAELKKLKEKYEQNIKVLQQIEFFLKPKPSRSKSYFPPYGSLTKFNTKRLILDSVGTNFLEEVAFFYLDLLETSTAIYERNGDYALGIYSCDWCRFLDQASRNLCETDDNKKALESGKWLCHESCWTHASKVSIERGKPVDNKCLGGLRIYAIPIWAEKEIVGSINVGYGNPPQDPKELQTIAKRYNVNAAILLELAENYQTRPSIIIDLAKIRLAHAAKLIGEIILHRIQFDNLQRQYIYTTSHELRMPLSIIVQSINNLIKYKGKISDEQQSNLIEMLTRNVFLINGFIEDLMLVSAIDQAKIKFNWIKYYPIKVLEDVLKELEPYQKAKDITIEYAVIKNLQLYGDPKRTSQIFRIIIDNAIKYSGNGTKIQIKSIDHYIGKYNLKHVDGVLFQFKDEGRGINEKDIQYIFQRFFRAEEVRAIHGTGLGLSIARELVELHQGEINVESTHGMGSTFFIFFPRLKKPPILS